jgi:hypothetical protein
MTSAGLQRPRTRSRSTRRQFSNAASPFINSEFKAALGTALAACKPELQAMLSKNPWSVPISMGTWGSSSGVTGFATEMYFLHEAFPDSKRVRGRRRVFFYRRGECCECRNKEG